MMKKNDYFSEKVYITISEAAEQFFCGRVTEAALYRLAREGKLPTIRARLNPLYIYYICKHVWYARDPLLHTHFLGMQTPRE